MGGGGYQSDPPSAYRTSTIPTTADGFLGQVQTWSSKVEDVIENYTQPIRPYVPAMARFLIVVTFLEGVSCRVWVFGKEPREQFGADAGVRRVEDHDSVGGSIVVSSEVSHASLLCYNRLVVRQEHS